MCLERTCLASLPLNIAFMTNSNGSMTITCLELTLERALKKPGPTLADAPGASHRGAGAVLPDPARPAASTTLFDFNGFEQHEQRLTSVSLQAPPGAERSVVLTADQAAAAPLWVDNKLRSTAAAGHGTLWSRSNSFQIHG